MSREEFGSAPRDLIAEDSPRPPPPRLPAPAPAPLPAHPDATAPDPTAPDATAPDATAGSASLTTGATPADRAPPGSATAHVPGARTAPGGGSSSGAPAADGPSPSDPHRSGSVPSGHLPPGSARPAPAPSGASAPALSGAPAPVPGPPSRRARGFGAAALAVAALLGSAGGWAGASAWRSSSARDAALATLGATAVVTSAEATGDALVRTGARLHVLVTNLGEVPVTVGPGPLGFEASSITGLEPTRLAIPVGRSRELALRVAVACGSPQPLLLAPLWLTGPDGAPHSLIVDGAGQVLVDLCASGPETTQVLRGLQVAPDGSRLRVTLTAPTGRITRVSAVYAGGVRMSGDPLPVSLDGPRAIWLDLPPGCPAEWSRRGFPRTLSLQIDAGGPATVEVPLGYELSRWLLVRACRVGAP